MNKGVTYRPLMEGDAYAPVLVLTRKEKQNLSIRAFMSVIDEVVRAG